MANISWNTHGETVVELTKAECAAIIVLVRTRLHQAERKVEHYLDILDGGDASDRDTDALAHWEDEAALLKVIYRELQTITER